MLRARLSWVFLLLTAFLFWRYMPTITRTPKSIPYNNPKVKKPPRTQVKKIPILANPLIGRLMDLFSAILCF